MKKKNNKFKNFLDSYSKWVPPKILILLGLIVLILLIGLAFFEIDNDFWFLINLGRSIINNGIPNIEPFTIHSNLDFIAQQWLTDVIFYLIYDKFGIYGMLFLLTFINTIVAFLTYKLSMLLSDGKIKLSFLVTIIFDVFFITMFLKTRPQAFDTILLLLEIYLLELYVKKNKKTYLIGLPLISILMINFHSSIWSMLFVFLLPYFAERIKYFSKEDYQIKPLIIITILMFICGLINPYGIEAIKYLFNSYGVDIINNLIGEMKPIQITNCLSIFCYMALIIYAFYYNKGKNKTRYFFFALGTVYLALNHYRAVLYFLICTIPTLAYNFKNIFKEKAKQEFMYQSKPTNILIGITILICISIYGYYLSSINLETINRPDLYEIGKYLTNNVEKTSIIYTGYDEGSYIEYLGYKCYLDPRAEVFLKANNHKEDILQEWYYLQKRKLDYQDFLEKYNFDYLIVSTNDILYYELETTNYELVFEKVTKTKSYRVYKKA